MSEEITKLALVNEGEENAASDVDYLQTWKITEFTEVVNETFKQKHNIELNITVNTLNNYFRELENDDIHYLNRLSGVKIYDQMDLNIAEYIAIRRSKKLNNGITWQLPQIFDAIKRDLPCRPKPEATESSERETSEDITKQLEEFKESFKETLIEIVKHEVGQRNDIQQQLIEMKQANEKQVSRTMVEVVQKQGEFRAQARAEWDKKSPSERLEGLIFKREKIKEREQFIDEYVEKKFMEWIIEQTNS
ncbi:hypothetical protein [Lysinibacillus irui]|uniref:MerR family transcriptional regulator n=1 Tax=Lysinibacillus irui TaxID=2998077 RepID=A0AAJ5RRY1_9BACI|nr:hypothetical protein [Lysinibacillus irui]WDV09187.1 hypothetical protein OU989_23150 [Lysinibacillus irui]